MISRERLDQLYTQLGYSATEVAEQLNISSGQVNYWLKRFSIPKRSISEAIYRKRNPAGDPFTVRTAVNISDAVLYGIGIGLYWGEGTKANKHSVRLGNSNPALLRTFILFLERCYSIDKKRLRFGLQVFGDMDAEKAVRFWIRYLCIQRSQIYPSIVVTPHRGVGTYRHKTKYGVMTVYFNNKKLRDILCNAIDEVANKPM